MAKTNYRKSSYSEKLKDPRWQKKRLEILERDGWECQMCFDKHKTLHVHHLRYEKGEPWEIENEFLITLCFECHEIETKELPEARKKIIDYIINSGWDSYRLSNLFYYLDKIDWNDELFLGYILSIKEDDKYNLRDSFVDSVINKTKTDEHRTNN